MRRGTRIADGRKVAMDSGSPSPDVRFLSSERKQAGFAYLAALVMIAVVVIGSAAVLESVTATVRRDRENEMIWRGNQYARAIRMYYRKVGRYPTSVDDLMQGVPGLRFLRQEYKDPMNKEDGAWRFIYLNQAGQIVGSSRYASLQQMAVMDALGLQPGQIPQSVPGQPGVSVASMASGGSGSGLPAMGGLMGGLTPALPYRVISSDNPEEAQQQYMESPEGQAQLEAQQSAQASGQTSGDNSQSALLAQLQSQYPNITPDQVQAFLTQQGATPDQIQAALSAFSQAQAQNQNQSQQQNQEQSAFNNSNQNQSAFNNSGQSQSAFGNSGQGSAFSNGSSSFGSSAFGSSNFNSGALQSQGQNGQNGPLGSNPFGQTQSLVAAANSGILQQKPTGPVDGPVIGGFLTGVGSKVDRKSVIWYHGAKKYEDWEFIWNPLEDQAAALQQQINQTQSTGAQGGLPVANPFGGSTGPSSNPSPQPAPPNQSQPQQ